MWNQEEYWVDFKERKEKSRGKRRKEREICKHIDRRVYEKRNRTNDGVYIAKRMKKIDK